MLCLRCLSSFSVSACDRKVYTYDVQVTLLQLRQDAGEGCLICYRLLNKGWGDGNSLNGSIEQLWVRYKLDMFPEDPSDHILEVSLRSVRDESATSECMWIILSFERLKDFEISPQLSSRNTGSEETTEFIREKLRDCNENHPLCAASRPQSSWYPTRLIDLRPLDGTNARIIITSENLVQGPYISLSHCWGDSEMLKLTTKTLDQFLEAIDNSVLPRTFLDAFEITRALDIQYVWIDSLCIIQDSKEDWNHEVQFMMKVYQYAYCNIASTHSRNSHGGIFSARDPGTLFTDVRLARQPLDGTFRFADAMYWKIEIDEAPLNQRAWVVQERLISPRIIHFASEQVFWDCYQLLATEVFPSGARIFGRDKLKFSSLQSSKKSSQLMRPKENEIYSLQKWADIVEAYSGCDLTFPEKDKINAISGIARQMGQLWGWESEYCAGLWRRHLESQICWRTSYRAKKCTPSLLRAPSWSWLSIDGPVHYTNTWWSQSSEPSIKGLASVTDVHLWQEVNELGNNVSRGHINLRCILNTIEVKEELLTASTTGPDLYITGPIQKPLRISYPRLDYCDSASGYLFFIPLYQTLDVTYIQGILVKLVDEGSGSYMRCGQVTIFGSDVRDNENRPNPPEFVNLKDTKGKENLPCVHFDKDEGHLIRLV